MYKKSQMEIMGLAMIMILVTLGIFFIALFTGKGDDSLTQGANEKQLAGIILNSLLKMNAPECGNKNIESLIQDCQEMTLILCHQVNLSDNSLLEDDVSSCEYINATIRKALDKTIGQLNRDYYFEIIGMDVFSFTPYGVQCDNRDITKETYPIGLQQGSILTAQISICGYS
jgi:hypothetical protein